MLEYTFDRNYICPNQYLSETLLTEHSFGRNCYCQNVHLIETIHFSK